MSNNSFEATSQFESRKQDHIKLSLNPKTEAMGQSGLDRIELIHEAFPELDFSKVSLAQTTFDMNLGCPMFVSSMTAGHPGASNVNEVLAVVCEKRNWAMGVGSQRRELFDPEAKSEWQRIRRLAPKVSLLGNIGISQLIFLKTSEVQSLIENLAAKALFIHTNPLQECFQPEGTPNFSGGLKAIERICREISIPVIVKEVGCGFSEKTLHRLKNCGISAVDVSGKGGTHWGRIEGYRSQPGQKLFEAAQSFKDWGVSTVDSLLSGMRISPDYQLWASGGVRSGLDAARLIALGAKMVGFARPILEAALAGPEALEKKMELLEFELRVALFCTGSKSITDFQEKKPWKYIDQKI
ncbi:MAG: type 2 isopentenyl-diphosphate Delta-isomerase [Pseudomonadota bacterium]|nr:type 2 isopentenyl-diphosphate Delta-isomerase [Pseudomonadota bacterium]